MDTSSPPNVVQRQYSKPYGETAWEYTGSAGSSLTDYGYTGQRSDADSGLMYYGARYYDPVLSFFISADTIAPSLSEPHARGRYSYVSSNPIRYTDPTGYCKDNPAAAADGITCASEREQLKEYGIIVDNPIDWTLGELLQIMDGIQSLMLAFQWDLWSFRFAMGIDDYDRSHVQVHDGIHLIRKFGSGAGGQYWCSSCTNSDKPANLAHQRVLAIYGDHNLFTGTDQEHDRMRMSEIMVHELAHAWDDAYHGQLSSRMAGETRSTTRGNQYYAGGNAASEYGGSGPTNLHHNQGEDWAEAVAGYVFPDRNRYRHVWSDGQVGMDDTRRDFVARAGRQAATLQRYVWP